ncbi:pyruvate/2-oxoglutarate/acetoin dehydrogenase E1 component [Sphingobacterium allocomposti]|uniref:3-methyl-2-oxobutanoate dehydrogenase (2-methylpropanoyl-transferring) n=1 Tax=Sphingobacterium allocomposti TaxID=415956 RepID=A0A5S5DRC9_9SPHI|nr:alpha-ketoacid dehydrogenase subunit alpha/beta [Sphingobacterium composti Yoo et al. 2007 non Ten et al. 2007]TYP97199.1 pyruvate/2-oxoglutarate/acetoin dehydrogenase E1 component [Sphingobacterium composti Yoo et al. 2007 non Ten et al. 2007]
MSNITMNIHSDFETSKISFDDFREIILNDYKIAVQSRFVSLFGRKEVLTGKAKFGIFGDGKEIAQIALAKVFKPGDWRSGYYRDQTFAFASGISNIYHFFSQLYANPDLEADISSGGRQMNCHFSTQLLDSDGKWVDQTAQKNSVSDISTTGGQMSRVLGLGLASKLYRQNDRLDYLTFFSNKGNEVVFCTVGNASTSEGVFWETVNAVAVKQIPVVISIWDDGYGISVPNEVQTAKADISEALRGFQRDGGGNGLEIFKVRGWDYPALCEVYEQAAKFARDEHVPCIVHVTEMTQPQGHSTSGSHERYKSAERLEWENAYDCNVKMREWMLQSGIAKEEELATLEKEARDFVRQEQRRAWADYHKTIQTDLDEAISLLSAVDHTEVDIPLKTLQSLAEPSLKEIYSNVRRAIRDLRMSASSSKDELLTWYERKKKENYQRYNDKLFTDTAESPLKQEIIPPSYDDEATVVDGREVLNACFDANFARDERIVAFGEDVGKIGDVNQGFAGLQHKFGELRIFDTGIRESAIIGKGLGLAVRGLRPIAEIQYLDYLIYAMPVLSDDLASLSYRTKGTQKSPVIIRTRGHRLEGIWHSGSPMSVLLGGLRGIHICVPRNMTQAAGMYNTLLRADEPALVVECLNGYRLKEKMPSNVGEFTVPIGVAERIREGNDITVVSYGATLRIVQEAAIELEKLGISLEIIDAQCLQPFDQTQISAASLAKTNKLLVVDEDMPGGASAFILQEILENQKGYFLLDGQPRTLSAKAHRPPYGSDGDYFTKPSVDDVIELAYEMMSDYNQQKYPKLF